MTFSVVVPAYNEEGNVGDAVRSLALQDWDRSDFEIIVVDNNSTDRTSDAARLAKADRVVVEIEKGTNMARNRGYKESRGDIVAFLDADSEPPVEWLQRIARDFADPAVAAVSGPYNYGFQGFRRLAERFFTYDVLRLVPPILKFLFGRRAGVLIGGNFAVRRTVLDDIGGIPPLSFWGDDATLAMMIARRSGKVFFDPWLRVRSSPRRFEKEGFLHLQYLYTKAYFRAYFAVPGR